MKSNYEFDFNGKKVIAKNEDSWTLNGVDIDTIKKLDNAMASNIIQHILELKKQKEKEERAKYHILYHNFKQEVEKYVDSSKYDVKFLDESLIDKEEFYNFVNNIRKVTIYIKDKRIYFEVYYDNKVYGQGDWYSHSTSKVWIKDYDYKKVRYATLEKAIKAGIKNLEEKVEDLQYKQKVEYKVQCEIAKINKELLYTAQRSEHYHSRYGCPGYTEKVIEIKLPNKILVHISHDDKGYNIQRFKINLFSELTNIPIEKINNLLKALADLGSKGGE